jgi:hypothetical protein
VLRALEDFFGGPLTEPRFFSEKLSESEIPNLDLALEDFIRRDAKSHKLLGFAEDPFHRELGMRAALSSPVQPHGFLPLATGPAVWKRAAVGVGQYRDCLSQGIHLIESRSGRLAVALVPERYRRESWTLEVLALDAALARDTLDGLRETMVRLSVYRGKTITLKPAGPGCGGHTIEFVSLDAPAREQIILPEGLLELIERNAFGVRVHRERLLAAGRHLRRGLLFHGKPGTGKTFTAKYLLSRLHDHTAVLLAGPSLGLIEEACQLARLLAPSAVIIEDVDLIARERTDNRFVSVLHDLLDQMDGLGSKVEVLFILTTNRPDLLEPALASRPGRVDQAVEFPLPDRSGRSRLFELYARGLRLEADIDLFLDRTEGGSGAFIAELLRRALVFACEQGSAEVRAEHLESALREIVLSGGGLTRSLLGFEQPPSPH